MELSAVSVVVWDLAFRYFMAHRIVASCFTSDVGRLAHQPCCHEPSCTLLRLQPISSVFGVRVCGSPPHLLMNWANSSNCPPKLSQGTPVRFRKIARRFLGGFHHCWKPRCRVHPFTRHVSSVLWFSAFKGFVAHIAFGWLKAKVGVVTACQPLALPLTTSLSACP